MIPFDNKKEASRRGFPQQKAPIKKAPRSRRAPIVSVSYSAVGLVMSLPKYFSDRRLSSPSAASSAMA